MVKITYNPVAPFNSHNKYHFSPALMPQIAFFKIPLIIMLGLLGALWYFAGNSAFTGWAPWLAISVAYYLVWSSILHNSATSTRKKILWPIVSALIIVLIAYTQNAITSIYLCGSVLLFTWFIFTQLSENHHYSNRATLLGISSLIGIALLASPLTISRVVLHLPNLPVPSKFELHSNENANNAHFSAQTYPTHYMAPFDVELSSNNFRLYDPMPLIRLQARRDTHFIFQSIQYDFLNIPIYALKGNDLHQIVLHVNSDEVRIDRPEQMTIVTDIGADESAWFELPKIDPAKIGKRTLVKAIAVKVFIWVLICLCFLLWAPGMSKTRPTTGENHV